MDWLHWMLIVGLIVSLCRGFLPRFPYFKPDSFGSDPKDCDDFHLMGHACVAWANFIETGHADNKPYVTTKPTQFYSQDEKLRSLARRLRYIGKWVLQSREKGIKESLERLPHQVPPDASGFLEHQISDKRLALVACMKWANFLETGHCDLPQGGQYPFSPYYGEDWMIKGLIGRLRRAGENWCSLEEPAATVDM